MNINMSEKLLENVNESSKSWAVINENFETFKKKWEEQQAVLKR